jgi:hypothetical protein
MSFDACLFAKLEIIYGGLKICLAYTVDSKSYAVFAGIKHSVLTRAIVLELKKHVSVFKRINVLGFSLIKQFHIFSSRAF